MYFYVFDIVHYFNSGRKERRGYIVSMGRVHVDVETVYINTVCKDFVTSTTWILVFAIKF